MNRIGFIPPPSDEVKQESQGEIPYSLSRLEFLELKLNAMSGALPVIDNKNGVYFWAKPAENTMTMHVYHRQGISEDTIKQLILYGNTFVHAEIEKRGWDWVNVEVVVTPHELNE